jgi:hypothetical protein
MCIEKILTPCFQNLSDEVREYRFFQQGDAVAHTASNYRISRPIRHTFFPEKCDLNATCVLCTEGNYYFQTYYTCTSIIQHLYHGMILVAVTMIFWVSVMNKYIMVDNFGM